MTARTSSPLAAAVGLVVVTAEGVRRLPGLLAELPPAVVRQLEEARQAAWQRYGELAQHGQDVLAGRHPVPHRAAPEVLTEVVDTSVSAAAEVVDTAVGTAAEVVDTAVGTAAEVVDTAADAVDTVADAAATAVGMAADAVDTATEPPAAVPPPGLTEPVELPEDVLEEVAQLTPGADLPHAELPLPDFDHMTVPQLRGRLRTLQLPQLVQLRDYEQAHAARLPVLTLLDNRIAKLAADQTGQ